MDEKKFDALRNAVDSLEAVLWVIIGIGERNGMSQQEATNINIALSNYRYYMGIAQGDSISQAMANRKKTE